MYCTHDNSTNNKLYTISQSFVSSTIYDNFFKILLIFVRLRVNSIYKVNSDMTFIGNKNDLLVHLYNIPREKFKKKNDSE